MFSACLERLRIYSKQLFRNSVKWLDFTHLLHNYTCVTDESEEAVRLLSRSALKNIPYFPFAISQLANIANANVSSNAGTYVRVDVHFLKMLAFADLEISCAAIIFNFTASHHITTRHVLYVRTALSVAMKEGYSCF